MNLLLLVLVGLWEFDGKKLCCKHTTKQSVFMVYIVLNANLGKHITNNLMTFELFH